MLADQSLDLVLQQGAHEKRLWCLSGQLRCPMMPRVSQVWGSKNTSHCHSRATILAKQATEANAPTHRPRRRRDRIATMDWRSEIPTPMWTLIVVVQAVLTQDRFQVSLIHDQHPIETLLAATSDPSLRVRIRH